MGRPFAFLPAFARRTHTTGNHRLRPCKVLTGPAQYRHVPLSPMRRPPCSVRCRVRISTFATLSLGVLLLFGTPVPVSGAPQVKSVFHEIMSRLRPGGLEQGARPPKLPTKGKSASRSHRGGGGNQRRREALPVAQTRTPRAWDTAYAAAETELRGGDPAVARPRFEELLATAPTRAERDLVEYRLLLLDLLAGREDTTVRFLTQEDRLGKRPPAYFYLQSALARHRGQPLTAQRWAARAVNANSPSTPADIRRQYVDALREPGELPVADQNPLTGLTAAANPAAAPPARVAMVEVLTAPPPAPQPGHDTVTPAAPVPALALRRLTPGGLASPSVALRGETMEGGTPPAGPTPVPEASRRPEPGASRGPKEPAPGPAAPPAPATPAGKSIATAPPGIRDKFEAAQGLYTQRDLPGALRLLDEIEATQPNLNEVRNLRALLHYEVAYRQYIQQDYAGALRELDEADEAQAVADTSNLRGLVLARQRQYDRAEAAFRKAVAADPTLWAAKFNLADLPFGYRNYTEARQRFEALTAETDRATQPRQAELTEFKVFLTLLLEGRESAARSFMSRFKADGVTPARLYAQAALDFRAGRFDRAIESVKDARKKYPPALEGIFAESFYRVGWLTDGSATPGATPADNTPVAVADATSAAPTPEVTTTATPPPPTEAEPTPPVVAAATPTPVPAAPSPAVPEPTPTVVAAATPPPIEPSSTAAAAASEPPPASPAPSPVAAASEPLPPATIPKQTRSPSERLVRDVLPWGILVYVLAPWLYAARMFLTRHRRRLRARRVVPLPRYPAADKVMGREKV